MKDKSANERLAYNQKIQQQETNMEELQTSQRQVEELLSEFEFEMTKQFHRLQGIQEEMMAMGSTKAKWEESERQGKQAYLTRLLNESRLELDHHYRSAIADMDDERAQLQSDRDALPWE